MFIYVIVCTESLKIYVGQHKGESLDRYFQQKWSRAQHETGKRSHLYAALRKHPRETWSIHPLISGIEDKKELDEWERLLIYALKSQHPDVGYNICDGGEGHTGPLSEDQKRRQSEYMKSHPEVGRRFSGERPQEWVEAQRAKVTGQKRTPETCQRISLARKGKGMGDQNANHRDGLSVEHKKKIGDANAKTWTPERRREVGLKLQRAQAAARQRKQEERK